MNYFWKEYKKNSAKMGNRYKPLLLLLILTFINPVTNLFAQAVVTNDNSLLNLHAGMQAFGFRTQDQWDEIRAQLVQPYFPSTFSPGKEKVIPYLLYPYWQGRMYLDYYFVNIRRIGYFGYLLNPDTGNPNLTYSWTVPNMVKYAKADSSQVDLVLFCQGENETSRFLQSEEARENCIQSVIRLAQHRDEFSSSTDTSHKLLNADGINVYFPDFTFQNKRQFGLFIKDLYMNYSYRNDSVKLLVTFPIRDTIQFSFLKSLDMYIDELYFADYDYRGLMSNTALCMKFYRKYRSHEDDRTIFQKIWDEIRLAEFRNPFHYSSLQAALKDWSSYFIAICAILSLLFLVFLSYLFWGKANQFINEHLSFLLLTTALLITEVLFLSIFMIEKMNYTTLLINTDNPGSYYLLLIPFLLALIFPLSHLIQKRKELP